MHQMIGRLRDRLHRPRTGKRIIMTLIGVFLCAFSVGMLRAARVGVDPFQVLMTGLNCLVPVSYGTFYPMANLLLLGLMFLADRHYIGLGTVLNLFVTGYVVEFAEWLMNTWFPVQGVVCKIVMVAVALVLLCLSSALYYTSDMGVSTYDIWALLLDKKTCFPFRLIRICTDLLCVGIGFVLLGFRSDGKIGIGTIITALCMGPLVDLFNRVIARPFLYGRNGAPDGEKKEEKNEA